VDAARVRDFLASVQSWAGAEAGIAAVALVGSHARGEATPKSDVDLIFLADHLSSYLDTLQWIRVFGEPLVHEIENWGIVTAVRVWYADGLEVEFGITALAWGEDPGDEGTARVIRDGIRILHDPRELLSPRIRTLGR
jgi:predicted nucleotidyltransferase